MAEISERGLWINNKGEEVHKDLVRPNEQIRDELVEKLCEQAKELSKTLAEFKGQAGDDIESYFNLLLQNYGLNEKKRSKKGNMTLENFSGTAKVQVAIGETLSFDEKLNIAKMKIDEYLTDITKDSDPVIKTLVTKAFEVDKQGKIDAKKIFALKSYEIADPRWREAMEIIDESKKVSHVKPYIRFYTRESIEKEWKIIPLDIAGVEA
jgi:hypothetical protein